MDTSKIIRGVVSNGRYTVTAPIVKEDYGLYLQIEGVELPSTYEVDFSNEEYHGTSVTMIGNADGVRIPRQFIDTGKDVFAFLYWVGEDYGKTVYKFHIPNKVRPDRTNEQPTPEEQSVIDQAIGALNTAVAQTAQDRADADVSAQNASADADRAEEARTDAQNYATQAEQARDDAQTYANNASASATASAQSASQSAQIKSDVESLADDAQGYAQASAQSATASANSATTAQGFAQSASASAQSASGYASQAQTSAQTASTKAQDASQSATTASAKATESAQSASQALSYKTDAESAKTASQTAQGLAESARDTAVQAKEDAESARDEAQNIVDGISAKAEQIDANTASVASLEEDRYKPYVVDSASGSIASFSDGADDLPLKSLVIDINPVQDLSHGDPSPENLCPISGWTEVQANQSGINVWDEEWEVGGIDYNTGATASYLNRIRSKNYVPVKAGESLYVSSPLNASTDYVNVAYYDANKIFVSGTSTRSRTWQIPDNACFLRFAFPPAYGTTYNHDISINYPSTDHSYHPYTGRSITINLGQTVYGGKLDVLSGELVIDRAMVDLGTLRWYYIASRGIFEADLVNAKPFANTEVATVLCSQYVTKTYVNVYNNAVDCSIAVAINSRVYVYDSAYTDVTAFKTAMDGVMACYELATPLEIQLTPNQVNSLLGVNNIWADSGDSTVEYRADTKLFIERLTAPDSADMIADANITSGQYFMVGNSLFKATANIANGSAIVVGTNCIRKSLSEALNEINA